MIKGLFIGLVLATLGVVFGLIKYFVNLLYDKCKIYRNANIYINKHRDVIFISVCILCVIYIFIKKYFVQ